MHTMIKRDPNKPKELDLHYDGSTLEFRFGRMGYSVQIANVFISFCKIKDFGGSVQLYSDPQFNLAASLFSLNEEQKTAADGFL